MDLDEFLAIHEDRATKVKNRIVYTQEERPPRQLLSNLFRNVCSNFNQKRSNNSMGRTGDETLYRSAQGCIPDRSFAAKVPRKETDICGSSSTDGPSSECSASPPIEHDDAVLKSLSSDQMLKAVQEKRSGRSFIPEEQKTDRYWEKRKKNNEAAKKSRQHRRRKELEILDSVSQLEDINSKLVAKVASLEEKNRKLERILNSFGCKHPT